MPRRPTILVIVLVLAALAVGPPTDAGQPPASALVGIAATLTPPPADPFPLRRTFLTGDRLAAALAQAARGTLVKLPREEFEARVRAAAAAPDPPRLAEVRYRATLTDAGLTGTAEWRVAAAGPGLLPLDPLRVALADPKWADGSPAAIVRATATAQLVVPKAGDSAVSLNWSARGIEEPIAERFDLALPAAAVATLELDLPADRIPTVASAAQLLTGPLPGPTASRRLWRIAFGGQTKVDLAIRRPRRADEPTPLVRAGRAARFDLTPGVATFAVEFDLEAVRGSPTEWVFEADPGLRVTDVTGPRLSWRAEANGPGQPTRVRVTTQDALPLARVTLSGFAPLVPGQQGWPLPQVRLPDALPGADAIDVRIDAELNFAGCDSGDYRVTGAGPADRGYRVGLTGTLLADNQASRRPPTLRVRPTGPAFAATEDVTWRIAPGRTDLSARLRVRATHGPVAQFVVEASPGVTVEAVRLVPDDPGLAWGPLPGRAGAVLVEPSRPLPSGQSVELRVDARGPAAPAAPDPATVTHPRVELAFPQLSLGGAAERDGTFAIAVDPALAAWASPAPTTAALAYPFLGHPPAGRLFVAPRTPRVTVTGDTVLSLERGDLVSVTTLTAHVEEGAAGAVTLMMPDPPGWTWDVKAGGVPVPRVPGGELLPWAGALAGTPWVGATLPPVGLWRAALPQPVTGEVTLTVTGRRTVADTAEVPLPRVLGAEHADPRVTLDPSAARFEAVVAPFAVTLRPRGATPVAVSASGWEFAGVELVARIGADGRLSNTFAGTVTTAGGPVLPVELPAGATVEGVLVAGKHADHLAADRGLRLPLPEPRPGGTPFEVRYTLPADRAQAPAAWPLVRFDNPVPHLPGEPTVAVKWAADAGFRRWPELDSPNLPTEGAAFAVVPTKVVTGAGYALAAVALGVGVALRRRAAFLVVVAGLGAAVWLVPPGWVDVVRPPLVVGLVVLTAFVLWPGRREPTPNSTALLPTAVSVVPAVLVAVLVARAQGPEPVVVYVVPEADRLAVLAPQSVFDRLDALARPPIPSVALASAEYDAAVTGNAVTIAATFQVVCTQDGEHTLNLPLTGVRLESMELDGKPAFPDASRPDRYAVLVRGVGRHVLVARFVVPAGPAGIDREARFGTPDLACTKVRFTGPAGATRVDVPTRRGAQTTAPAGDRRRAYADHGGGRAVAVRWRDGTTAAGGAKTTVTVREACVWELGESTDAATAVFLYKVEGGAVGRLAVEIPDGLEPARPVVRTADGGGLRDWRLDPGPAGWRTLRVDLQEPVEGAVTLLVKLFPRTPTPARPVLRFPHAVEVAQSDGYLAVRLARVTADDVPRTGVIDLTADALVADFGGVPELGLSVGPPDAVFRRAGGAPPEVRPVLRPATEPATGLAETVWAVGPGAFAEGVVQVARPGQTVVEFELPTAVRLHELRSADVFTWGRSGSRVQAWLRKPTRDVTLRWTGSLAEFGPELPAARLVGVTRPATVRVRPATGWAVVPQPAPGTKPLPLGREIAFTVGPGAPPKFAVLPPVVPVSVEVLEHVEPAGDGWRYRATVRVPLVGGRPHHFAVRLAGLPTGAEAEVRATPGAIVGAMGASAWDVFAPVGGPEPLALTLTVGLPVGAKPPEAEVSFGGPPVAADRTRTVAGGLSTSEVGGRWVVSPAEPPRAAPTPALPPSTDPPALAPAAEWSPVVRAVVSAVAWAAGLAVVLGAGRVGRRSWWPERLAGCGLLAAVAVGPTTPVGLAFLGVAGVGVLGRAAWAARHVARLVLR